VGLRAFFASVLVFALALVFASTSVFVAGLLVSGGFAHAADSGAQEAETHGSFARLIHSPLVQPSVLDTAADRLGVARDRSAQVLAGLQVDLAKGWKTYWRMPGDAGGVAPEFGFGRSSNIASAVVGLPAPSRLWGNEGQNIGYKGEVVFPVLVTLAEPSRPAVLRLDLFYGLCREICIPAQVQLEIPVGGAGLGPVSGGAGSSLESARHAGLLSTAVEALPVRLADSEASNAVAVRPAGAQLPRLVSAWVDRDGELPEAVFSVAFPEFSERNDLFVEPPAGLYLAMTRKVEGAAAGEKPGPDRADGSRADDHADDGSEAVGGEAGNEDYRLVRFRLALPDGSDLDELLSSELRVTMVAPSGSVERMVKLATD